MTLESADRPHFDPVAIERLRKVAGDQGGAFVAEMAQLFLDEATKSLEELRTSSNRDDLRSVSRLAHSLKSSAATLGLMRLSDACKALEYDTKPGVRTEVTPGLMAVVFDRFEEAIPTLKTLS